jgi:hypothetical protein
LWSYTCSIFLGVIYAPNHPDKVNDGLDNPLQAHLEAVLRKREVSQLQHHSPKRGKSLLWQYLVKRGGSGSFFAFPAI